MPLHPELASFLELVQLGDAPPMHRLPVAEARRTYEAATELLGPPGAAGVHAADLRLPRTDGGDLAARLYSPQGTEALPALLFFHGGGYVVGSLESHDALCRDLAERTPCKVLAVDYRLAPEHRFPAAHDDAFFAWDWLERHHAAYGIAPGRLAVGGDSVGGTLAASLCLRLKAEGRPQPLLQMLLYPCTSSVQDSDSHRRYASGHLLEAQTLQWMFGHYLNSDADRSDWRFAPLLAPDLAGLASAHVALAECDPLVDEGVTYAQRLSAAGVPATLAIYPGMAHDFARLGNIVADADCLCDNLARALGAAFERAAAIDKQAAPSAVIQADTLTYSQA